MLFIIKNRHRLMKILFSAVILQLLYISVCLEANLCDASGAYPMLFQIPEMLRYAAASAVAVLGGGFLLEFAEELCKR